ncbi:hypothetical protein QL285_041498 [Trifolium repens]|nr:hypothetical protein QL285_041498 [Trifolium repens]
MRKQRTHENGKVISLSFEPGHLLGYEMLNSSVKLWIVPLVLLFVCEHKFRIRFSSTWRCNHKPSNLSTTPARVVVGIRRRRGKLIMTQEGAFDINKMIVSPPKEIVISMVDEDLHISISQQLEKLQ